MIGVTGEASQTDSGTPLNLNDIALGFINTVANNVASTIGGKPTSTSNTAPQPDWAAMSTAVKNVVPTGVSTPLVIGGIAVVAVLGVFLAVKK